MLQQKCITTVLDTYYMSLKIREFLGVSAHLALQATKVFKQIKDSGKLHTKSKGATPVTVADLKVEGMIRAGILDRWPTLKIVGQEQTSLEHQEKRVQSDQNIFRQGMFLSNTDGRKLETQLDIKDCCVWIDPLDATTSYTRDRLGQVSCLIGLSFRHKARLGVVGLPFKKGNDFSPRILVGDSDHDTIYVFDKDLRYHRRFTKRQVPKDYVIANIQNGSEELKSLVNSIGRHTVQTSGTGHKVAMMLYGGVDALVFPGKQSSKWDTCASEALIKAVGGRMTTLKGEDIRYDPESASYNNLQGLICTLEPWQLEDIVSVTKNWTLS